MKGPIWRAMLEGAVTRAHGRSLSYEAETFFDCLTFCADCIEAMSGERPGAVLHGYDQAQSRALSENAIERVEAEAQRHGWTRVKPLHASYGDLAVCALPGGRLTLAMILASPTTVGPRGLRSLPVLSVRAAWCI